MIEHNELFIQNLKNALNDKLKLTQPKHPNRTITLLDLTPIDENKYTISAKVSLTDINFFGINDGGQYDFKADAHIIIESELNNENIKIKQASPYTLNIDINGPFAIKAITKKQYFNVIELKENPLFSHLNDQEKIEFCIDQQPNQDILQKAKTFNIEPFTIQMIYSSK